MTSTRSSLATTSTSTSPAARRPYTVSPYLALEACASSSQRVSRYFLIDMHSLRVLAQVVKARKSTGAVTLERSFTGVFSTDLSEDFRDLARLHIPDMPREMLTPCKA